MGKQFYQLSQFPNLPRKRIVLLDCFQNYFQKSNVRIFSKTYVPWKINCFDQNYSSESKLLSYPNYLWNDFQGSSQKNSVLFFRNQNYFSESTISPGIYLQPPQQKNSLARNPFSILPVYPSSLVPRPWRDEIFC